MNIYTYMKFSHILTATNLNTLYCDFIPVFVKVWKKLFPEIIINIILIANEIPDKFKEYSEHLILFKPINGINDAFVAQFIRLLYPCIIDTKSGVMITDIDMIPMNKEYYIDNIQNTSDDKFVCYRDCIMHIKELPMCYNVATPAVWREIFNIKDISQINSNIITVYSKIKYDGKHGGKGWGTDQTILFEKVMRWNTGKLVLLNDTKTKYKRLCRLNIQKTRGMLSTGTVENIKKHKYTDYHMLRPYNTFKKINDFIVDLL